MAPLHSSRRTISSRARYRLLAWMTGRSLADWMCFLPVIHAQEDTVSMFSSCRFDTHLGRSFHCVRTNSFPLSNRALAHQEAPIKHTPGESCTIYYCGHPRSMARCISASRSLPMQLSWANTRLIRPPCMGETSRSRTDTPNDWHASSVSAKIFRLGPVVRLGDSGDEGAHSTMNKFKEWLHAPLYYFQGLSLAGPAGLLK